MGAITPATVRKPHLVRRVALGDAGIRNPTGLIARRLGQDLLIRGPMIEKMADHSPVGPGDPREDSLEVDGGDLVALPALVEPHAHLDKALSARRIDHGQRTWLRLSKRGWRPARHEDSGHSSPGRANRSAVPRQRDDRDPTHTDTGEGIGTRAIEAVLSVRA